MRRPVLVVAAGVLAAAITSLAPTVSTPSASAADASGNPVIAAVGDMACDTSDHAIGGGTTSKCGEQQVSDAVKADLSLDAILGLGDFQYYCSDIADWQGSYDPTWGRLDYLMDPVAGNHEYQGGTDPYGSPCPASNATATNYFNHFPTAASPSTNGHYSFNLGTWHIIALNGNCANTGVGGCGATSPQTNWLNTDLNNINRSSTPCVLAFWHQPLYTGVGTGTATKYRPWWNSLYNAHADVVLNGHVHNYQRFPALNSSGVLDPLSGITEYIAGTGGEDQVAVKLAALPKPAASDKTFGYLRMTLLPDGWKSEFVDTSSGTVSDQSVGTCHL